MSRYAVKLWKVMETLVEGFGFDRDNTEYLGDDMYRDTYSFENIIHQNGKKVWWRIGVAVEYSEKHNFDVEEMWCDIYRDNDMLYEGHYNSYGELNDLAKILDELNKDYDYAIWDK